MVIQELIDELKKRLAEADRIRINRLAADDEEGFSFHGGKAEAYEEVLDLIKETFG